MASRRDLKKNINYISEFTFGMCLWAGTDENSDRELIDQLLQKAHAIRREALTRISHTEPGNVKQFYTKVKDDFFNSTKEIYVKLEELIKK